MASLVPATRNAQRFLHAKTNTAAFRALIPTRVDEAAQAATAESRKVFKSVLARPLTAPRPGRPTTHGLFVDYIKWSPGKKGFIEFDSPGMYAKAPYFLILEIGTNRTATILNPPGFVTVRTQIGRTIPFNLYWASGPGGIASNAVTGASGDQLYLASEINAQSLKNVKSRRKRIRREIKGRHYLQAGGVEGFRYLGEHLVADAQKIFK